MEYWLTKKINIENWKSKRSLVQINWCKRWQPLQESHVIVVCIAFCSHSRDFSGRLSQVYFGDCVAMPSGPSHAVSNKMSSRFIYDQWKGSSYNRDLLHTTWTVILTSVQYCLTKLSWNMWNKHQKQWAVQRFSMLAAINKVSARTRVPVHA